jgi:tetrahydromethanopterin S-methyltransferase subunit B
VYFPSISELKQIEVLVNSHESKLHYFYKRLARPDNRRGMVNIGGLVLKALFGTATTGDFLHIHQAIDELQGKEADIVHSLENQMTYTKSLELPSRGNSQAISI